MMLTKKNSDGTWSVNGINFKDCPKNMYGALCKLRDYETTGLEPYDFRSDNYEKKYLYKVFYRRPDDVFTVRLRERQRKSQPFLNGRAVMMLLSTNIHGKPL